MAETTSEVARPSFVAMALTVVLPMKLRVNAPTYRSDCFVGSEESKVYLISLPAVKP